MSDAGEPLPQRIGDAERDHAAELLRDHLTAGRLDQVEFDDRLTQALTAKTIGDLTPLFTDLPGPKPGSSLARTASFQAPPWEGAGRTPATTPAPAPEPVPFEKKWNTALTVASSIAWPVVIITCFAIGWDYWWLIFIPIFLSSWLGKDKKDRDERRDHGGHRSIEGH